jgi:hypothetical protein
MSAFRIASRRVPTSGVGQKRRYYQFVAERLLAVLECSSRLFRRDRISVRPKIFLFGER